MMKKILVIDDEEFVTESLKKLLKKSGYEVEVAKSGNEAIAKVQEMDFDLIVSDIRMPDMDGVETIKMIRECLKQNNKSAVPEIFITGYASKDNLEEAKKLKLKQSQLVAFGSTRKAHSTASEDDNLRGLLAADTQTITIFGKSWDMHVTEVFKIELEENLLMIRDSVKYLRSKGKEVFYDAEHFFDGYAHNPRYALKSLEAALESGASALVLCDTNGGSLPSHVLKVVQEVKHALKHPLGIHTHNDAGLGVANALSAVQAGAVQVQGTINGIGERCGNCDLVSVIANLQLKLGYPC